MASAFMVILLDDSLPAVTLAATANPMWLSIALTAIGVVLLLGLLLTYAKRRPGSGRLADPAADRRAIEDLLADAEELASRLAANLDAKASRLDRLVAQADERLERLERAVYAKQPVRPPEGPPDHDSTGPLNRRIYDLADRGVPPVEIARQLSQQVGQVELILNLRRE